MALVFCFCSYSNAETIIVTETIIEIETGTRLVEEEYEEEVTIYTTVTETVVNTVTEEVVTTNTTSSTETVVSADLMAGVCGGTWTASVSGTCQDTDGDGTNDRYRATYYWTNTESPWIDLTAYLDLADTFTITWGADIWNNCPQKIGGHCGGSYGDYYTDDYTMILRLKDQDGNLIANESFDSNLSLIHI